MVPKDAAAQRGHGTLRTPLRGESSRRRRQIKCRQAGHRLRDASTDTRGRSPGRGCRLRVAYRSLARHLVTGPPVTHRSMTAALGGGAGTDWPGGPGTVTAKKTLLRALTVDFSK